MKQRSEWPYGESLMSQAKREHDTQQKKNENEANISKKLIAPFIHKTSWKQDVINKEFVKGRKSDPPLAALEETFVDGRTSTTEKKEVQEILKNATQIGGKSKLTQNILYMLQIWESAEKMDLEKALFDNVKPAVAGRGRSPDYTHDHTKRAQREKSNDELLSLKVTEQLNDPEDKLNTKTLSKSTIRQLRKLLNESHRGTEDSQIDVMLRKTLTGTEEGEPEVILPIPLRGGLQKSSLAVVKKARKPIGRGGVEVKISEHEEMEAKQKFKLILPDIEDDMDDDDDIFGQLAVRPTSATETKNERIQSRDNLLATSGTGSVLQKQMEEKAPVVIDVTEDLVLSETLFALPVLVLECIYCLLIPKIQCRKRPD